MVGQMRAPGRAQGGSWEGKKLREVVHCWPSLPRTAGTGQTSQSTVWSATVLSTYADDSEDCDCVWATVRLAPGTVGLQVADTAVWVPRVVVWKVGILRE